MNMVEAEYSTKVQRALVCLEKLVIHRQKSLGYCSLIELADVSDYEILREEESIAHIRWMCQKAHCFLIGNDIDISKAERWLSFAQGVLWAYGISSFDDFRKNNRS